MDPSEQDQDKALIELLGKLKDSSPEYPRHLRAERRASVLASLAAVPAAQGILGGASLLSRLLKTFKALGMIEKIVVVAEFATVVALTSYGAVTAYRYRYALQRLLFPAAASATPFPTLSIPSPAAEGETQPSTGPAATLTGTPTMTVTPFGTWTLQPGGAREQQPQMLATQAPANEPKPVQVQPTATRGLRLGQTKTPQATP